MECQTGVLLVNLGTPNSPNIADVFSYLTEFLTDPRVITLPWLQRQLLVRGVIIPSRVKQSTRQYEELWHEYGSSPLLVYGKKVEELLQNDLGSFYKVILAMRYGSPSIKEALKTLESLNLKRLIIIPLFPQYASATTGSVHEAVMEQLKKWTVIPELTFVKDYFDHPLMIEAFCQRALQQNLDDYEEIIFSFHGLPEKQILAADRTNCCLKKGCCQDKTSSRKERCYKAACYETARAIAEKLKVPKDRYSVCFQSRLGKDPWIEPYTLDVIHSAAKRGVKRLLVFSPSFICDCLETVYEIKTEYAKEFCLLGGERLDLVEGLNDHPLWISALKSIVESVESKRG